METLDQNSEIHSIVLIRLRACFVEVNSVQAISGRSVLTDDAGSIVVDLHKKLVLLVDDGHAGHVHRCVCGTCLHNPRCHLHD